MKPVIIAICGKSASGKTTLAVELKDWFKDKIHIITSSTTRPKRPIEDDSAYHFLSKQTFEDRIKQDSFLEYCKFRGWYYGTEHRDIQEDKVNVGVFNPAGMRALLKQQDKYIIVPVYCYVDFWTRISRSLSRDGFKFEILRRALVDWKDFYHFEDLLIQFDKIYALYLGQNFCNLADYVGYWIQYVVVHGDDGN